MLLSGIDGDRPALKKTPVLLCRKPLPAGPTHHIASWTDSVKQALFKIDYPPKSLSSEVFHRATPDPFFLREEIFEAQAFEGFVGALDGGGEINRLRIGWGFGDDSLE